MDRMKALMRLKEKRGESKMSDEHKEAKKGLLKNLIGDMQGMMAGPMKKVTVASDSQEGLKHGLEKAKEVIGKPMELMGGKEAEEMCESPSSKEEMMPRDEKQGDEEMSEEMAHSVSQESEMTPEEIDSEIQRLMEMKNAKLQKE